MPCLPVNLGLALTVAAAFTAQASEDAFDKFCQDFGKNYTDPDERAARRAIFEENHQMIDAENAKNHSYVVDLNLFADFTGAEFGATRLGYVPRPHEKLWDGMSRLGPDLDANISWALPLTVDWASADTPVMDQGSCGSCWAIVSASAMSSAWKIKTGGHAQVSTQQILDCSGRGTAGCFGGEERAGYVYARGRGLCAEWSYPYEAQNGKCRDHGCQAVIPAGSVLGYREVRRGSADALMAAVMMQPVSAGMGVAFYGLFRFYRSGIFNGPCGINYINHAVVVVGYGGDNQHKFWRMKNSWGSGWGEGGYFRMLRRSRGPGTCGMMTDLSFPVVRKPWRRLNTEQPDYFV